MLATIKFGRKRAGKLMPGWAGTLSEEEMWTVIAAIVSLRHADGEAAGQKGATEVESCAVDRAGPHRPTSGRGSPTKPPRFGIAIAGSAAASSTAPSGTIALR